MAATKINSNLKNGYSKEAL